MAIAKSNLPDLASQDRKSFRAAIYARVSTANNGQDPTMQARELREYCERRGWKVGGEYVDEGFSGTKDNGAGWLQETAVQSWAIHSDPRSSSTVLANL